MVAKQHNIPVNSPYKKQYMRKWVLVGVMGLAALLADAQAPKSYTASELLQQLKKLNVLGSVLYVAAHPDDENTRLLAWLANEKLYRTGYLSLTRGDGGQNLIGDEQGIDLGLIRTQELLAARRVDGAEQFFTRAYDFGYSKSPDETMRTWGHDEILSDVVWVIRKFRPDVIICRFPTTGEGGHGHHTASAMLAEEAFDAAADPNRFPDQLKQGVGVWQAKRLLWNTFNFGGNNTQRADQFKVDVGQFNPLLGKSYGEIAAQSRSQHKSQGFGVPAQRGSILEYFKTIKGTPPVNDLMDGVDPTWNRLGGIVDANRTSQSIDSMVRAFDVQKPESMALPMANWAMGLRQQLGKLYSKGAQPTASLDLLYLLDKERAAGEWIANSLGLYVEVVAANQLNVKGDSIRFNANVNVRNSGLVTKLHASVFGTSLFFDSINVNQSYTKTATAYIDPTADATQPYWLEGDGLRGGRFAVDKQIKIGLPEYNALRALFEFKVGELPISLYKPVQYKFTDPVKGELYQPVQIVNPVFVNATPSLVLFNTNEKKQAKRISVDVQFNKKMQDTLQVQYYGGNGKVVTVSDTVLSVAKGDKKKFGLTLNREPNAKSGTTSLIRPLVNMPLLPDGQDMSLRKISYDHIPDIYYQYGDVVKQVYVDLKTEGSQVGYIVGAGDKVPEALEQMGYKVTLLKQSDIVPGNLKQFDAIVTGVRAYNTNDWMNDVYDVLMDYVKQGGTLLVQYNTSSQLGPVKAKIGPYPFSISRNRITDETAAVNFLQPGHDVLNYPNKITQADFDGWVQERSIYHAEKLDSNLVPILSMADPGEKPDNGSLVVAAHGKGRFIYTGLVFFRELPAGVPGAYRLLANLIAPARKYYK
jgi:LmbE family N-acetylglucosaminyl deacetylase